MDGTLVRNLHQFLLLLRRERARELHRSIDAIEQGIVPHHAIEAVLRVHSLVGQPDGDGLERPLFRSRIQRNGHRHAGTKRGHE